MDLFVGENPLGSFPPALAACSRLEKLGLAACGLRGALDARVGALTALKCGARAAGAGLGDDCACCP